MKIIFIATRSIEKIGGIETYMAKLAPKLAEKNHNIVLYCLGDSNNMKLWKNITIQQIKGKDGKFTGKIKLGLRATLHAMRHHNDADIFHYHAMGSGLSSIIPIILRKKVIFQGHGFEWQRTKWNKLSRFIIKSLDSFVLKINKNIVMVSQNQSDYVSAKFHKPVHTITPGIDIPESLTFNDGVLKRFSLEENEYFLFLGRLVQEKRADILIKSFINSNITNKKLVIAGDDPYEKKYIESLKKLALNNKNIIFTGSVFGIEKENLLAKCFAFCIPSELEGLPITLLEAMSYKKYCIASNILACKEALGQNGVFFKVNDIDELIKKLQNLCNNQTSYKDIGNNNYLRVKKIFTWDKIADHYEKYCLKLIK